MKTTIRALLAALLTVAVAAVAVGCGGDDSTSSTIQGNSTDRAFVAEMVPHHRSAVEMAEVAQTQAQSAFVKGLADDIIRTQNAEIAEMATVDKQLAADGIKEGDLKMDSHMMGMDMSASSLKGAKPFDPAFIKMMVPHHKGAIAMAKAELAEGKNTKLKQLATAIVSAQEREVKQMDAKLASLT